MKDITPIEWKNFTLKILDQTLLPDKISFLTCKNYKEVAKAIKEMKLRGAPLIGIVAAFAMIMEIKNKNYKDYSSLYNDLKKVSVELIKTRPTAVNLKWAVDKILNVAEKNKERRITTIKELLIAEANRIYKKDLEDNKSIGKYGAELIRDNDKILTHCNAGALATSGYGTALGIIRAAVEQKKKITVYVDETRPYLQGARLTAFELVKLKVPHFLITDNMAGYFMKKGEIDVVIVGADRITANGDVANKIGTYTLAVLAHVNNIPFYVAAPSSTIDLNLKNGDDIPIEFRSEDEVRKIAGKNITTNKTKALHPAFDITPAKYVTAIITEKGIIRAPYATNLETNFASKEEIITL